MTAVIEICSVSKHFKSVKALDKVSCSIKTGTLTGLVGPDGAGKTTLMRMMTALMNPTAGTIFLDGHDVSKQPDVIHELIGYMPQRFGLYEDLAVIENLNLYAELRAFEVLKKDDL